MGQSYYLACKDCKVMVNLGKLTESFYPDSEEVRVFMQDHILHQLVITGDAWHVDSDIIKFGKDNMTLWDTDYEIFDLKADKKGD